MAAKEKDLIAEYQARQVLPYKKPCLDSSMFIAKFNEEICGRIKRYAIFDWLWEQARDGKFQIYLSAITLAEVHFIKRRKNAAGRQARTPLFDAFFELINEDFVKIMEVSERTAVKAHELCRSLNVLPNDGIIIANALEFKCDVVLAYDVPMIGKNCDDLRIEEPCIYERNLLNQDIEIASEQEQEAYDRAHNPQAVKAGAAVVEAPVAEGDGKTAVKESEGKGNGIKNVATETKETEQMQRPES